MGKVIWFAIAVLWLCVNAVSQGVILGTSYPVPETVEFILNMISYLLIIILLLSKVAVLARMFIWCLRGPVLISLVIVTVLSKILMQIEHRIAQFGNFLAPSTSSRRNIL